MQANGPKSRFPGHIRSLSNLRHVFVVSMMVVLDLTPGPFPAREGELTYQNKKESSPLRFGEGARSENGRGERS